jgi:uncharacterized OsmC-like protein
VGTSGSPNPEPSAATRARSCASVVAERQAPLCGLYAESPPAALTRKSGRTSSATVAAGDPFHGEVEVGRGYAVALRFGLDRQIGGHGDAPNPGDLLCAALAACQDGAIRMIANLLGVELTELEVEVSGQLDVRGCLGADSGVRVGFEALECKVHLTAKEGTHPNRVETLVAAAERFCVNLDTLRGGIEVRTSVLLCGQATSKPPALRTDAWPSPPMGSQQFSPARPWS